MEFQNKTAFLNWDADTERIYETGVKRGVLYVMYSKDETAPQGKLYKPGVVWNGLNSVTESPSGAEANAVYADDTKYVELRSAEEFGATIEAYTYPDEFAECDGSKEPMQGVRIGQQIRKPYGLSYVTTKGNDTELDDYGYKIHIIWKATASPSEKAYQTINDSPEAITFSWEMTTTPTKVESVPGAKPSATMVIDANKIEDKTKLKALEDILWGTAGGTNNSYLPTPDEVLTILGYTGPSGATGATGATGV